MHGKILIIIVTLAAVFAGGTGNATAITLTDGNSSATINASSQAGMNSWTVDGVNQLNQQWFWYRVGATGREYSVDTIGAPTITGTANTAEIKYFAPKFSVTLSYTLLGGLNGSGTADVAKIIRINNTSASSLDFHFFEYSNFYIGGSSDNTISFDPSMPNTIDQSDLSGATSQTVATPYPSHWEIAYYDTTLQKLNNPTATTLSDSNTVSGSGNVTWAFQWDRVLLPGRSLLISNDTGVILPVPEPMTFLLLFAGLAGAGLYGRLFVREDRAQRFVLPRIRRAVLRRRGDT